MQASKRLSEDVASLTTPREFKSWVDPDVDSREDTVEVFRRRRRKDGSHEIIRVPQVTPAERQRRRSGFQFETEVPALIDSLEHLRGGTSARVEMTSGRRAPSSRPPAGADVAELLVDISSGAAGFYRDCLISLGRARETRRRDRAGHTVDMQPDVRRTLQLLVDVIDDVEDLALQERVLRSVRSWRNAARLLMSHNAAMSTLAMNCPMCSQQTLMVRDDASTDVICGNPDCVNDNGEQTRWPRARWALLLQSAEGPPG